MTLLKGFLRLSRNHARTNIIHCILPADDKKEFLYYFCLRNQSPHGQTWTTIYISTFFLLLLQKPPSQFWGSTTKKTKKMRKIIQVSWQNNCIAWEGEGARLSSCFNVAWWCARRKRIFGKWIPRPAPPIGS